MQRLFSTFPNEWPAAGLLLLRLSLASSLFADAAARVHGSATWQILSAAAEILTGALLALGVWTPIVGVVVCLLQLGIVLMTGGTIELSLLRAAAGLSLALLGPGAWSIDAHLFGRRRIEIEQLSDS